MSQWDDVVFFSFLEFYTHTHSLDWVCLGGFDVDFITVVKTVQITIQIRIAEPHGRAFYNDGNIFDALSIVGKIRTRVRHFHCVSTKRNSPYLIEQTHTTSKQYDDTVSLVWVRIKRKHFSFQKQLANIFHRTIRWML